MNIKQLRKKFVGNYYIRERVGGPTDLFCVDRIVYNKKSKRKSVRPSKSDNYDIICISMDYSQSVIHCIGSFNFSLEERILSPWYMKVYAKRVSQRWVKCMIEFFINDLNKFAGNRQVFK